MTIPPDQCSLTTVIRLRSLFPDFSEARVLCKAATMAGLDEFYTPEDYVRRGYPPRRPTNVPQFEADSGSFFGSSKNSNPRLYLDPSKGREAKNPDAPDGAANAEHFAGQCFF